MADDNDSQWVLAFLFLYFIVVVWVDAGTYLETIWNNFYFNCYNCSCYFWQQFMCHFYSVARYHVFRPEDTINNLSASCPVQCFAVQQLGHYWAFIWTTWHEKDVLTETHRIREEDHLLMPIHTIVCADCGAVSGVFLCVIIRQLKEAKRSHRICWLYNFIVATRRVHCIHHITQDVVCLCIAMDRLWVILLSVTHTLFLSLIDEVISWLNGRSNCNVTVKSATDKLPNDMCMELLFNMVGQHIVKILTSWTNDVLLLLVSYWGGKNALVLVVQRDWSLHPVFQDCLLFLAQ